MFTFFFIPRAADRKSFSNLGESFCDSGVQRDYPFCCMCCVILQSGERGIIKIIGKTVSNNNSEGGKN
jgi:hypothetical protein